MLCALVASDLTVAPWTNPEGAGMAKEAIDCAALAGCVGSVAESTGAQPYDVSGARLGHEGERCSFDAFIARFAIVDAALDRLALIVRGADTGRPELTPQSPGLLAMSHGLSALCPDDHA